MNKLNVSPKLLGIGLVAGVFIVVVAYQAGKSSNDSSLVRAPGMNDHPDTSAPVRSLDAGMGQTAADFASPHTANIKLWNQARFTQFSVGNSNVKGLFVDDKAAWIGTSMGLVRYDIARDNHKRYDNTVDGIFSNGVFHVSKLDDKIVVGTYGGGLSIFDPAANTWKNYNIPQGLADQFVYDVQRVANGDIWIATWSGANRIKGGRLDDPSAWETYTVENTGGGLPNPWVYALEEGANGELWFATEAGLARFYNGEWTNWQHEDGLGASYETVVETLQSTSDPAQSSRHHAQLKSEQGLEDVNVAYNPNYIISLEVTPDGTVWNGTWGGGLSRFDGKQWLNFTDEDGLPSNHIFMLYLDQKNDLWVGTSKGLARLNEDGRSFSVLTMADGLFANNVFSMAHADDGSYWVGSFGGLVRVAPN